MTPNNPRRGRKVKALTGFIVTDDDWMLFPTLRHSRVVADVERKRWAECGTVVGKLKLIRVRIVPIPQRKRSAKK